MHVNEVIGYMQYVSSALASVISLSTSLLTSGQGRKGNAAILSVGASTATCTVRYVDDGTVPTATLGHVLSYGTPPYLYTGDLTKLKFIAGVGNPDLNVTVIHVTDS